MDVFSFALQKEDEAEKVYRDLANNSESPGYRKVFNRLADAELKHQRVIIAMRDEAEGGLELETETLEDAKSMFAELAESRKKMSSESESQLEIYIKAREMEKQSIELYAEQSENNNKPLHSRIFNQLKEQEKMHYILLDNMVEFVRQPETWAENAEFSHILDKYKGTAYYPGLDEFEV